MNERYVTDILRSVPEDVEQVTISPEGQWTLVDPHENNRGYPGVKSEDDGDDDDDNDLVEISNSPSDRASLSYAPMTPLVMLATPSPANSREQSSAVAVSSRNGNNKRPHEVVDLTLDSSDDDGPPPKRVSGPTSIPQFQHNVQQNVNHYVNGLRLTPSSIDFPFTQGRPPLPPPPPPPLARRYDIHLGGYR